MGAPKPKPKPIEFPNPDHHADLVALRKEMRQAVLDLRSTMRKGEDQTTLIEFVGVLHPGSFADPGRLPYDSPDGRSRSKRKENCLFAAISFMVQTYWGLVLNPEDGDFMDKLALVQAELLALRKLKNKELDACKVEGDDQKGYVLVR